MKQILILFLYAAVGGTMLTGVAVLYNKDQKILQQEYETYSLSYYSNGEVVNVNNSILNGLSIPRLSGNAVSSEADNYSMDVSLFEATSSNDPFSHGGRGSGSTNSTAGGNSSSGMSMDYSGNSESAKSGGGSAGGGGGMYYMGGGGGGSTSEASGGGAGGFMAMRSAKSTFLSDEIGIQADEDAIADPGRSNEQLQLLPVPASLYVLLLASLLYGIRIFLQSTKKQYQKNM